MKKLKKILKRVENKMSKKPAERDYNWRAQFLKKELKELTKERTFLRDLIEEREDLIDQFNEELSTREEINSIVRAKVKDGLVQSKVGYNKETIYLFKAAYGDEAAQTGIMFVVELPGSSNPECFDSGFFRNEWK